MRARVRTHTHTHTLTYTEKQYLSRKSTFVLAEGPPMFAWYVVLGILARAIFFLGLSVHFREKSKG